MMVAFLHLGVECAVIDEEGCVLLSRRGDLNVWNLPGGRLDSGERLDEAAAREVREETGMIARIERAVGLYYSAGWSRLNILFAAWPLGGQLLARTDETSANVFYPPDDLPDMPWNISVLDALAETRHKPRVIVTPARELRRVKNRLRWRWVQNLMRGRPEPRYPRFQVSAVGVIWEDSHSRVLTLPGRHGRELPRVLCGGRAAPWEQLAAEVRRLTSIMPSFRWAGLWQDASRDRLDFVFAATVEENELDRDAEWSLARTAAFSGRGADYVERVKPTYPRDPVWMLYHDPQTTYPSKVVVSPERS